jgi:hypothetical protein
MNSPAKTKEVKSFLVNNDVHVVGLLETKIKLQKDAKIQKKLGNRWIWLANYNHHEKGRVWVGWRQDWCNLELCASHQQFIATKITPLNSNQSFHIVFIYGLHNVRDRRELWHELEKMDFNSPCLYIGDYNAIFKEDHRKNGAQVTTYEMNDML